MRIQCFTIAATALIACLPVPLAQAQSGHDTRFSYHQSYHDRGYDHQAFRYEQRACESRPAGGLGLGALLDAGTVLRVDVRLGGGFTECDNSQYAWASGWSAQSREAAYWQNPNSGARGVVRPDDYRRQGGRTCASFESESWSGDGAYDRGAFEMCQNHRGDWEVSGAYERRQ